MLPPHFDPLSGAIQTSPVMLPAHPHRPLRPHQRSPQPPRTYPFLLRSPFFPSSRSRCAAANSPSIGPLTVVLVVPMTIPLPTGRTSPATGAALDGHREYDKTVRRWPSAPPAADGRTSPCREGRVKSFWSRAQSCSFQRPPGAATAFFDLLLVPQKYLLTFVPARRDDCYKDIGMQQGSTIIDQFIGECYMQKRIVPVDLMIPLDLLDMTVYMSELSQEYVSTRTTSPMILYSITNSSAEHAFSPPAVQLPVATEDEELCDVIKGQSRCLAINLDSRNYIIWRRQPNITSGGTTPRRSQKPIPKSPQR